MPAAKFSEAQTVNQGLVDARGFNANYDPLKGVLNGGLDRTSTEDGWVSRTHLAPNALHKVVLDTSVELSTGLQNSGTSAFRFDCLRYEDYGGGWYANTSFNVSGLREGMLHLEFSGLAWCNKFYTDANPKGFGIRVLWNGIAVVHTGRWYTEWSTPYVSADFPITGDGTLSLEFEFSPPAPGTDSSTSPQFHLWGGHILVVARFR